MQEQVIEIVEILVEERGEVLLHGSSSASEVLSAGGAACQLWTGLTDLTHQVSVGTLHDSERSD